MVVAFVDEHGRSPGRDIRVLSGTLAAQFTVHLNTSFASVTVVVVRLRHADAAHVQMVITPEETYGPGLQHVHVVFPVKLHSLHLADVVRMGDHEAPTGAVLQTFVAVWGQIQVSDDSVVAVQRHFHKSLDPGLGSRRFGQIQRDLILSSTIRRVFPCRDEILGSGPVVRSHRIQTHYGTSRVVLFAREAFAL